MIPYGKQWISAEDREAVLSVLQSDYLTQGPLVPKFEAAVSSKVGSQYAVAVNSATSALHIACLALGVSENDLVWTTPISFVATTNCALYCGARVDFVDIDEVSFNMSVKALEQKLIKAKSFGELPKVVIPVHLGGQSCNMEAIHKLSKEYGFFVIEDASHAVGAKYQDKYVGNCQFSDIAVFSFHPVKIITSGEGGMAVTNQQSLAKKMMSFRSHGITRDPELMTIEPDGAWFYQQLDLGYNYRLTDLHAALGISQLNRLDEFISLRHKIAARYCDQLNIEAIKLPVQSTDCMSSYHLFILQLEDEEGQFSRNAVFNRLRDSEVNVNLHYIPIYRHPHYARMGFNASEFPNAEHYYKTAISIPMFPNLSLEEQQFVVDVIKSPCKLVFQARNGFQDLF